MPRETSVEYMSLTGSPSDPVTAIFVVISSLPTRVPDVGDAARQRQHVPGVHRSVVDEPLLAVHHEGVVQAQLGIDHRPLEREPELHGGEERRRRDDVAVTERLRGGSTSVYAGLASPIASANRRISSRDTS